MSELDVILQSIRSARLASQASVHALEAVEKLLTLDDNVDEVKNIEENISCSHSNAVTVATNGGTFQVCECGQQIQI